nr:uroporphyrinogen-III synthase [Actinomyces oris]
MTQSTSRTDSTGSLPGDPREGGGAPLSGRVVLLPRLKERDRIASMLERAGARVLRAAVTRTVPGEAAALEATARRIMAGEAAWLVLTSARTVEALAPYLLAEAEAGSATGGHGPHPEPTAPSSPYRTAPPHTPTTPPMRVAVVGPATAKAWTKFTDSAPDLVARGSATALLAKRALAGSPATGGHTPHQEPDTPDPHDSAASPHAPITPPRQHQPSATIPPMRVAVVGPATARAWTKLTGSAPDLVARGSAAALLEEPALAGGPATEDHAPHQEPDISSTHHGAPSPHTPARSPESKTAPRGLPGGGPHDSDGRAHTFGDAPDSPQTLPEAARRVLLPASALADPALADGLRRAGWEVEQVAAYTTVTADAHDLPPDLERTWATGGVDAVVLTAPSTTRAVLELLGPPPRGTGLVAIGATTAAATHELSLTVAATAPSPTPEGVLQATIDATRTTTGPAPAPQEPP